MACSTSVWAPWIFVAGALFSCCLSLQLDALDRTSNFPTIDFSQPNNQSKTFYHSQDYNTSVKTNSSHEYYIGDIVQRFSWPVVVTCLIVIAVVITCLWLQNKKKCAFVIGSGYGPNAIERELFQLSPKNSVDLSEVSVNCPSYLRPYLLSARNVTLHEVLGHGAFGIVYRGELCVGRRKEVVAVKEFLTPVADQAEMKMLREVELMQLLGRHAHIVSLLGFAISFDRTLLVLEYCPQKDLLNWLKTLKAKLRLQSASSSYTVYKSPYKSEYSSQYQWRDTVSWDDHWTVLIMFMHQVADGMDHIASHKLVHCDLAARNILVHSPRIVKIADFGLARDVYQNKRYVVSKGRALPIRWMSLETLSRDVYTTKSDVWSFGVLLWEIATLGENPYSGLDNSEIYPALKAGKRLLQPALCCSELYEIMSACWREIPSTRPNFQQLKAMVGHLLEKRLNYAQMFAEL